MNSKQQLNSLRYGVLALVLAGGVLGLGACTLDNPDPGELSGPSELGTSVEMRALPDQLVADGFSSSLIEAVVRGPDGQRVSGTEILFDITRQDAPFLDLGNLTSQFGTRPGTGGVQAGPVSSVSDADGVARARYWAPFRSDQENDTEVIITGRPSGTDYSSSVLRRTVIFLRAANRPSFPGGGDCGFIIEPQALAYKVGEAIFFTATQLTGANDYPIGRYEWDFGDGTARGEGRNPGHSYAALGTYTVTLLTTETISGAQETCSASVPVTLP